MSTDAASPTLADPTPPAAQSLARAGAGAILIGAIVRATSEYTPLPHWDPIPPTALHIDGLPVPLGTLTPMTSVAVDALILLGSALVFAALMLARKRPSRLALALAAPGIAGVVLHLWALGDAELSDLVIGCAWMAGITGAVALAHAGSLDPPLRRVLLALILGFPALLVVQGAYQVLIEHPRLVADFTANKDERLLARGLPPGSPGARAFERRLLQPDPTGWFALSNVYASFVAAALIPLFYLALRRTNSEGDGQRGWGIERLAPGLLAIGCCAMLIVSGSKGAPGALLVAILGFGALYASRTGILGGLPGAIQRHSVPIVTAGVIGLPLLGILARGLIGEGIGELSLLFRAFYAETAFRIFLDNPLLGVGPDGFKEAYTLAKPPISPEEVASPHSIFFDWGATLGLLGLAWCALWTLVVWRIAGNAADAKPAERDETPAPADDTTEKKLALLLLALSTLGALFLARDAILPEPVGARLLGVVAWGAVSLLILPTLRDALALRVAGAGFALVLAAHAQIEVTPTFLPSAALFLAAFGVIASVRLASGGRAWSGASTIATLALVGVVAMLAVLPAQRWQSDLERAATIAAAKTDLVERTLTMSDPRTPPRDRRLIAGEIAETIGVDPATPQERLVELVREVTLRTTLDGTAALDEAAAPLADWRTWRASSNLAMAGAAALRALGSEPNDLLPLLDEALRLATLAADARPDAAPAQQNLANVLLARAELLDSEAQRRLAAEAFEGVLPLDPSALSAAIRASDLWAEIGEDDRARAMARRALEIDELMRLDREVRGLTRDERTRAQRRVTP